MHIIDIIIFLLLSLGTVLFGYFSSHKKQTASEYTSAGGRIPGFVIGLSIFASFCSSISYLGYVTSSYEGNWNQFVFTLSIIPAGILAIYFFVPFYRNLGSISAYSYLERRFGRWARIYASIFYLFTQVCRAAAILYLLAVPMQLMLNWNPTIVIILTGVAVMAYAQRGGMRSVIWTEALQGGILIVGAIVCMGVVIAELPKGFEQVIQVCNESHKFSLGSMSGSLTQSTFWVCLVYGLFTNLNNFGVDQSYTQRYSAAPSLREARKSAFWGSILPIPVGAILFLIGSAIYAFYEVFPYSAPTDLKADYIFSYFIIHELPTGFVGAMVACIFCAGMSTVATSITSSATIIMEDFWVPYQQKRHANQPNYQLPEQVTSDNLELVRAIRRHNELRAQHIDEKKVKALRLYSMLIAWASIGVAVMFQFMGDNALNNWWKLSSLTSGGVLGLFLLGLICRRAKRPQAIVGIAAGLLSLLLIGLQTPICRALGMPTFVHLNLAIVISTMLVFMVGLLATPRFWAKDNFVAPAADTPATAQADGTPA